MKTRFIDFVRQIRNFITNVYRYRKELTVAHDFDYSSVLLMMKRSLELLRHRISEVNNGLSTYEGTNEIIGKITRCIEIINNQLLDQYFEMVDHDFTETYTTTHNSQGFFTETIGQSDEELKRRKKHREVFQKTEQLKESEWVELFAILKGVKNTKNGKGSDLRSWWV